MYNWLFLVFFSIALFKIQQLWTITFHFSKNLSLGINKTIFNFNIHSINYSYNWKGNLHRRSYNLNLDVTLHYNLSRLIVVQISNSKTLGSSYSYICHTKKKSFKRIKISREVSIYVNLFNRTQFVLILLMSKCSSVDDYQEWIYI